MKWCARRAPAGFVGTLALIALIEMSIARGPWSSMIGWSWRSSQEAAVTEAPACEVLALGDSLFKCGLQTSSLERRLGTRAYNLAVLRSQPEANLVLLERALAAGARPKLVLIETFPGVLMAAPRINAAEWPLLIDAGHLLRLSWLAADHRLPFLAAVQALLPSLRAREELRASVRDALAARENVPRLTRERRERIDLRGAVRMADVPDFPEPEPPARRLGRAPAWRCRPEHEDALKRLVARIEEAGARPVWVVAPCAPSVQERADVFGVDARFDELIARVRESSPSMVVIDGRRLGLPRTSFYDPHHLSTTGAEAFTVALADAIAPILRASPSRPIDRLIVLQPRSDTGPSPVAVAPNPASNLR
jgi:hypothetical protein